MKYNEVEIPHQIKDEDKWFSLTKSEIFKVFIIMLIPLIFLKMVWQTKLMIVGVAFNVIWLLVSLVMVKVNMPDESYLLGGGRPIYIFVYFWIKGKLVKTRKHYSRRTEKRKGRNRT